MITLFLCPREAATRHGIFSCSARLAIDAKAQASDKGRRETSASGGDIGRGRTGGCARREPNQLSIQCSLVFRILKRLGGYIVMAEPGFVYALLNPSMPDLVKVGRTTRDPKGRADELSHATGVPTPFLVAYKRFFSDCEQAEQF